MAIPFLQRLMYELATDRCCPACPPGFPDLASQVAAALGADKLDDDKDVPQPTPPKMIEVLSDQVDVAVPDPKAPQLAPATDDGPQKASALGSTVQPSAARPGAVNPAAAKPGAVKPPAAKPPAAKPPKDSYALPATQLSAPRAVGLEDLRATVGSKRSHKFYYQVGGVQKGFRGVHAGAS